MLGFMKIISFLVANSVSVRIQADDTTHQENKTDNKNDIERLVIHNGSYMMQAGFGGEEHPRSIFHTIVGKSKLRPEILAIGMGTKEWYCGDQAWSNHSMCHLTEPIQEGIITKWDYMEKLWHHTFYDELRVDPSQRPVLLTESPLNTEENREKMKEMMFSIFNVPSLCIVNSSVLSLFASDISTGVVLDIGAESSFAVPIYKGVAVKEAIVRVNVGGLHLTDHMKELLKARGYTFNTSSLWYDRQFADDFKRRLAYVTVDFDDEMLKPVQHLQKTYELPTGIDLVIDRERFQCTEPLFQPSLIDKNGLGIHEAVSQAIRKCDVSIRNEICKNVIIAGGSSRFPGIAERLHRELNTCNQRDLQAVAVTTGTDFDIILTHDHKVVVQVKVLVVKKRVGMIDCLLTLAPSLLQTIFNFLVNDKSRVCNKVRVENVTAPPFSNYSTWIGGSKLCKEPLNWILKDQYDGSGDY